MSRHSHRGRHPHAAAYAPRPRPPAAGHDRPATAPEAAVPAEADRPRHEGPTTRAPVDAAPRQAPAPARAYEPAAQVVAPPVAPVPAADPAPEHAAAPAHAHAASGQVQPSDGPPFEGPRTTCTAPQLRRFIKSRPWIPMHELRRRFGIYGGDDDVNPVRVGNQTLFIGLPAAEARLMGELLAGGDVGYELSLDPGAPIVVGVYPMRPVARG